MSGGPVVTAKQSAWPTRYDHRDCSLTTMTRFKELRRIEAAIEHRNESELQWALRYCEARQRLAKTHSSHWYRIEKRIRAAFTEIQQDSD
jgi:hypothetical protein